jgi:hypothetical protein
MKVNREAIRTFEKWCKTEPGGDSISRDAAIATAENELKERIATATAETVLSFEKLPTQLQDLLSEAVLQFGHVRVVSGNRPELMIRKAVIWNLDIQAVGKVVLEDCKIGHLVTRDTKPDYRITNCMIGNFCVKRDHSVQRLEWDGGYLGQFHLDRPINEAFVGDVWFRDVKLPEDPKDHDVQWLRDTREALNARSNSVAAGIFHASELALSYPRKHWTFRVASRFYEWGFNFGNSIGLPMIWFAVVLVLLVVLAFFAGTEVARPPSELRGWQHNLEGGACSARLLRAGMYAMQSLNPLNLFGSPLVVLSHSWWAFVGGALSVAGLGAFALFLLSLRRHFKLE